MQPSTRATVVVVSHNSSADLSACLASLVPTLGPDDEVLVFDNASGDDSAVVAERCGARAVRSETNHGFGGANNRAAALARGRYLVFLNPDTVVEPGWLDALLAPLADGPGLTTPQIVLMDDPGRIDTCANNVHLSGITVCRGHGQPAARYAMTERVLAVSGAAFAIDRETFEQLGGFDETFFMYLEDTDLSLRAALLGVPCWYVAASSVRHRHVPAFGSRKLYWLERNRWAMLLKLWSARTLVALLPTLILVEILTWSYAALGGIPSLRAKAAAWLWLVGHRREVVAARRRTQRTRRVGDGELLERCVWRLDTVELIASRSVGHVAEVLLTPPLACCAAVRRVLAPRTAQPAASSCSR